MHILFLADNFPPEVNAPASRTFEHCREWVRAGHRVTVITCAPNFPKGRVFEGYRNRIWQRETTEGIYVIRVWSYITANEGFALRVLDYMSYMVSATLAALFVRGVDVIVSTSPQFFVPCAGYVVSRCKRMPLVFELRDLWPESIRAVGALADSGALRLLERLELFLYGKAAAIVSVTHSFRRNLISRGIDGSKIAVVTNGVDLSRFRPQPKDAELLVRYGLGGKFVLGYVGTHGMAHGLDSLLDAAARCWTAPEGKNVMFLFLGDGAKKRDLVGRASALAVGNVLFLETVPKDQVARYWSLLDVAIIHLKRDPLFTTVIPSKLFESIAMGIPILHGVAGESADIVEKHELGLVFEPENVDELCARITLICQNRALHQWLRSRCIEAARLYDRQKLASDMLEVLVAVREREITRGRT